MHLVFQNSRILEANGLHLREGKSLEFLIQKKLIRNKKEFSPSKIIQWSLSKNIFLEQPILEKE